MHMVCPTCHFVYPPFTTLVVTVSCILLSATTDWNLVAKSATLCSWIYTQRVTICSPFDPTLYTILRNMRVVFFSPQTTYTSLMPPVTKAWPRFKEMSPLYVMLLGCFMYSLSGPLSSTSNQITSSLIEEMRCTCFLLYMSIALMLRAC